MEQNKQCYMCGRFDRLYVKGVKSYNPTKFGFCREKNGSVQIHEVCESLVRRIRVGRSNSAVLKYLSDLLTEISEVRKVLESERGEESV